MATAEADAVNSPEPLSRIPVMIGGNGEQLMLPLVGRQADWWNTGTGRGLDAFRHKRGIVHRSAEAAKNTQELIGNSVERIQDTKRLYGEIAEAVTKNGEIAKKVTSLVGEIASASKEQAQQVIHDLGLDRPVVTQYVSWLQAFVTGHWGLSFQSNQSIAAYRSSASAALTPNSSASVLVCHQRVVASLVCGARTRAAISAQTRSRSGLGRELMSDSIPSRCIARRTAWT